MTDAERAHKLQLAAYRRQTRLAAQKQNQLVPENTVAGNALIVVIAIMSFLACLTLGAVTLVLLCLLAIATVALANLVVGLF